MQREASGLNPSSRRFCHTLNQQKVSYGGPPPPKDVKYEERSGNVYENKGAIDRLSDEMSGICAWLKPILQKITDCEGQFAVDCAFRTRLEFQD
jgi:hypothetical protein